MEEEEEEEEEEVWALDKTKSIVLPTDDKPSDAAPLDRNDA